MNTKEAIAHLEKIGWKVWKVGDKFHAKRIGEKDYCHSPLFAELNIRRRDDLYSGRQLVALARAYSSENNQNTAIKKNLKKSDNAKNRSAQRRMLTKPPEEIDDFLGNKNKAKEDDYWNWD